MNDPYMPLEERVQLTRRTLETIAEYAFGVHVMTKSDLVVRDIDVLRKISRVSAAVSLIITTADDELSKKVEPGTPPSSARFRAMKRLSRAGIETRVALMPTLPFIEDSWENVSSIIEEAHRCGAEAIIPWFGTSMRDRQRAYYHHRLDELSPGLRKTIRSCVPGRLHVSIASCRGPVSPCARAVREPGNHDPSQALAGSGGGRTQLVRLTQIVAMLARPRTWSRLSDRHGSNAVLQAR